MTEAKTLSLADIRSQLDKLDSRILALLDERVALTDQVADAKRKQGEGGFALRTARESQILRRLLASRKNASPGLIVRVWREIIGESLYRQGTFHISVWGSPKNIARTTELGRQRFGAAASLLTFETPEKAIDFAKSIGGVAVVALEPGNWWWGRLLADPAMSVVAILPELQAWGYPVALAVSQVAVEPSGPGDETLWVTDSPLSSYEIEQKLGEEGIVGRLLSQGGELKLFALAGFFQRNDARLARSPGRLTGVIGSAPGPFDQ